MSDRGKTKAGRDKKKPGPKGIPLAAYAGALRKRAGNATLAAIDLEVEAQSVRERIRNSPMLQKVVADTEQMLLDVAEGNVARSILGGDTKDSKWLLQQKGKKRGYGNKVEIRLDDDSLIGLVRSLGGDVEALRKLRGSI
jgi:hypothetical protein